MSIYYLQSVCWFNCFCLIGFQETWAFLDERVRQAFDLKKTAQEVIILPSSIWAIWSFIEFSMFYIILFVAMCFFFCGFRVIIWTCWLHYPCIIKLVGCTFGFTNLEFKMVAEPFVWVYIVDGPDSWIEFIWTFTEDAYLIFFPYKNFVTLSFLGAEDYSCIIAYCILKIRLLCELHVFAHAYMYNLLLICPQDMYLMALYVFVCLHVQTVTYVSCLSIQIKRASDNPFHYWGI